MAMRSPLVQKQDPTSDVGYWMVGTISDVRYVL